MGRVEEFLQHFVEQPYDPVKAHEYYLKNRDLKGRSTSGMSQLQKEAWAYSKDRVSTDKKQKVEADKLSNEQKIAAFQEAATQTRARISEKLKAFSDQLTTSSTKERSDITDELKSDIANVAPIPDGVTGVQRSILVEKRKKEIANIRDTASSDKANVTSEAKTSRQTNSDAASGEREKARTDLKTIIATTREAYTKAKASLDAGYETTYQKEYNKVLTTVAGTAKKSATKAKTKTKAAAKEKTGGIIYYEGHKPH